MNRLTVCLVLLAGSFALTGCVSSRYKVAPKSTPPAAPLNLGASTPAAEAVLHSVIVYRGPGSWKKNAYWDEYVVSLTNRSAAPIVVEAARLTDFLSRDCTPGDNPWRLEKESQSIEKRTLRTTGTVVKIGAGAVAASLPAYGVAMASLMGPVSGSAAAISGAVLPVYIVGTVYRNVAGRARIQKEFTRRRLTLPLTLAPGETRSGSLFFPVAPGPQRLTLALGDQTELVVALAPLAALHLVQP